MITPIKDWKQYRFGFQFGQPYPENWGSLTGQPHLGLDILCPIGTPVYAPLDGEASMLVGKQGGNTIHLKVGDLVFRLMHLNDIVKTGKVKQGDLIAYSGNSGTASNTPHVHYDISRDKLILKDLSNFIDPLTLHEQPVTLLVLGHKRPDLARIELEYLYMGVHIKCDYKAFTSKPKWITKIWKGSGVEDIWWNVNVAPLASGYDFATLIPDYWLHKTWHGYADKKQSFGIWRGFVKDTKKPRRYYKSTWNGKDQVTGTVMHELSHLMHNATRIKDLTHTRDKAGRIKETRFNMDRFKGWEVKDRTRMFKWSEYFRLTKTDNGLQNVKHKTKKLKMRICTPDQVKRIKRFYKNFIPKW